MFPLHAHSLLRSLAAKRAQCAEFPLKRWAAHLDRASGVSTAFPTDICLQHQNAPSLASGHLVTGATQESWGVSGNKMAACRGGEARRHRGSGTPGAAGGALLAGSARIWQRTTLNRRRRLPGMEGRKWRRLLAMPYCVPSTVTAGQFFLSFFLLFPCTNCHEKATKA